MNLDVLTYDKEYEVKDSTNLNVGEKFDFLEDQSYLVRLNDQKIIISPLKGRFMSEKLIRERFFLGNEMKHLYGNNGALIP